MLHIHTYLALANRAKSSSAHASVRFSESILVTDGRETRRHGTELGGATDKGLEPSSVASKILSCKLNDNTEIVHSLPLLPYASMGEK